MLAVGQPLRVRKLRPDGSLAFAWDGDVLACDSEQVVLRAAFNIPRATIGDTVLLQGDLFYEFYYWRRWYNVFQVCDPGGALKGWYCNLGQPPVVEADGGGSAGIAYVDLALDVWVRPDGSHLVLDEEDLAAILADPTLPANLADGARHGRAELLALVERGTLPRWPTPHSP